MGPVKLDSARFSWKRDISVSTEFQTTLVCVDDSRSSEPPRTNRETLLSERQINVDTRVCIYIYIYIYRYSVSASHALYRMEFQIQMSEGLNNRRSNFVRDNTDFLPCTVS